MCDTRQPKPNVKSRSQASQEGAGILRRRTWSAGELTGTAAGSLPDVPKAMPKPADPHRNVAAATDHHTRRLWHAPAAH